ncbi:MAG: 4-hydroxybenzoate 3-monooxygenase [Okeania sp. SIO3B3]|nr:4-hydroxybenzoate 3-monooxygenase [Okeania sp. SIO3B3]
MLNNHFSTKVCIIGAGPAGLLLANILQQNKIPCIVVEKYSREEVLSRARAGLIDHKAVSILKQYGLADRLLREGKPHGKCEFRSPEYSFVLEYSKMCEGRTHYTYPQQELLVDMIQKFQEAGGEIRFSTKGLAIKNSYPAQVSCYDEIKQSTIVIDCDFIAGCDGFHGIARKSIPEEAVDIYYKNYNFCWLAITAAAPPSTEHIIYAIHPYGFAGHMLRNEKISRYYLQISLDDSVDNWSDERVWSELHVRLAKDGWSLTEGKITDKQVVRMRSYVSSPIHYKHLFLAGDAAHILTPSGGKGMNLAIQDAEVLGKLMVNYYLISHNDSILEQYSAIRLPEIWQTQEFSHSLLHMVNRHEQNSENDRFIKQLQQSKISQLMNLKTFAADFSRKYVGSLYDSNELEMVC